MQKNSHTLKLILDGVSAVDKIEDDVDMENPYIDEYTTTEQRKRDMQVTKLLETYVKEYQYKHKSNKIYKMVLFGANIFILLGFSIAFIIALFVLLGSDKTQTVEYIVELISVCVTFIALIVGILKIVARYVFPKNEEEYITKIVRIIQNNDLKNKQENIRVKDSNRVDDM